jgi:hypothetical protein
VAKDNTVQWGERIWQIGRTPWRGNACRLPGDDLRASGRTGEYCLEGPQVVGRFTAQGEPPETSKKARANRCGNDARTKAGKTPKTKTSFPTLPSTLGNPAKTRTPDSHIPTARPQGRSLNLQDEEKAKTGTDHLLRKADILTCYEHHHGRG